MKTRARIATCSLIVASLLATGCADPGSGSTWNWAPAPSTQQPQQPSSGQGDDTPAASLSQTELDAIARAHESEALAYFSDRAACMMAGAEKSTWPLCEATYEDCMSLTVLPPKNVNIDFHKDMLAGCRDQTLADVNRCADGMVREFRELFAYLEQAGCSTLVSSGYGIGVPNECLVFEDCQ